MLEQRDEPVEALLRRRRMVEQLVNRLHDRVVHVRRDRVRGEADLRRLRLATVAIGGGDDPGGNADGRRFSGNVANDDGVRADLRSVPDVDRTENFRARADDDVAAERRMTLALVP